jgi:hypothetical protein
MWLLFLLLLCLLLGSLHLLLLPLLQRPRGRLLM